MGLLSARLHRQGRSYSFGRRPERAVPQFLTTVLNRPLLYVHGNHDDSYDRFPPEGCDCVDDKLVVINGLRIVGLGGSMLYNEANSSIQKSK